VLARSRCRNTAAADQDAGNRTLHAAEDSADDRANTGASADLGHIALDTFALDRIDDRSLNRIVAAVDRDLIERQRHLSLAIEAPCLVNRADHAANLRPGRNQHAIALRQIDGGRRAETVLDDV